MNKNHVLINLSSIADWPDLAAEVHYKAPLLAKRLRVNPRKLQREFRRQLNTTPKKHLDLVRASAIKELARHHMRTKEIRVKLEFKHDFQVCRHFTTAFGTSLKAFRRSVAGFLFI